MFWIKSQNSVFLRNRLKFRRYAILSPTIAGAHQMTAIGAAQAKLILKLLEGRLRLIEVEIERTKYPTEGQLKILARRIALVEQARAQVERLER